MNEQALRIALAKLNLPQIALAKRIGVDASTFSRWRRGWYPVPQEYRTHLIKILKVDERDLFPDSEVVE